MKADNIKIAHTENDNRIKVSGDKAKAIKEYKQNNEVTYQYVADLFEVSYATVYYICNPSAYEKRLKKDASKWKKYYNTEKHIGAKQKLRDRKRLIIKIKSTQL